MPTFIYKDILTAAGLSQNEAIVYEYLIKNGETTAGEIIKKTPLKRGVVYNALKSLIKKELVEQKTRAKIAYFSPNHPSKLREFVEAEEDRLQKAERNLVANLPRLVSDFNLALNKPGVKFFEGLKGIKQVTFDTLNASEIYTYADAEAIVKHMDKINKEYVKKRDKLGIKKKIILVDTPFNRQYLKDYYPQTTDVRFIDHRLYPFSSVIQIYDNKVSYITLTTANKIGIIIEDPNIYQTNRSIFEFVWAKAKTINQLPAFSKAQ